MSRAKSSDEGGGRDSEVFAEPFGLFLADGALAIDGVGSAAARTEDRDEIRLSLARFFQKRLQQFMRRQVRDYRVSFLVIVNW